MTQYAIITDLNKCVGCLACSVACKTVNEVPIGMFWNQVLRVGPTPKYEGATVPDVEMYHIPVTCQHCVDAPCIGVCPTGASFKAEDGTVQIDEENCIGCLSCMSACPYGVRSLNEDTNVVQKCTLCEDKISEGELPQCVAQCNARARFFGDLDEGYESFIASGRILAYDATYDDVHNARVSMLDVVKPFTDEDVHHLPDDGNGPSFAYILRDITWQGEDKWVPLH